MYSGHKDRAAYALTKSTLRTLMRHVVRHYSAEGVRCNLLIMGWTLTPGELQLRESESLGGRPFELENKESIPLIMDFIPLKHVTDVAYYLLVEAPISVTGSTVFVNGGEIV
jgi:NAD(P)-dependent dehydrogenase (short-subunit alcohol dehydrogenase family)